MLSPRFLHITALLLIFLITPFVQAKPEPQQQHTQSTLHYSVSRPSDRWRFDSIDDINTTILRWNRYGDDLFINVQFHDAINVLGRDRNRFKQKVWFNAFKKAMTQPYLDRQFRIVSFKPLDHNTMRIEGVNSDRNYLLVDLHFVKANYYGDYLSVEMVLENKDYLEFRDAFYSVSDSVILN